jgi:hypothetical protein
MAVPAGNRVEFRSWHLQPGTESSFGVGSFSRELRESAGEGD